MHVRTLDSYVGDQHKSEDVRLKRLRNHLDRGLLHDVSVVRELLDTVCIFNLDDVVRNMVEQDHMYSKSD